MKDYASHGGTRAAPRATVVTRLSPAELNDVRELSAELRTLHLDRPSELSAMLPRIRGVLDLENVVVFSPTERLVGWGLERLDQDNLPQGTRFASTFASYLEHAPRLFEFFDPLQPEPEQRNRVVDTLTLIDGTVFRASCLYREVLVPCRLQDRRPLRALICEGGSLLAWAGTFHDGELAAHQYRRFTALLPALRERLSIERLLRRPRLMSAALDLVLDQVGEAAFVVGGDGELVFANTAGRVLLDRNRGHTVEALQVALRGRAGASCNVVPLDSRGMPPTTLVVLRRESEDAMLNHKVATAATRWSLTPRQQDVLRLLVAGHANATIASMLDIGERAVELHVTAMFDRLGLDSRAALVARVLLMS